MEAGDTVPGRADDNSPGSRRPETECRTVNLLWLIAYTAIIYHGALWCVLRSHTPAYGLHACYDFAGPGSPVYSMTESRPCWREAGRRRRATRSP